MGGAGNTGQEPGGQTGLATGGGGGGSITGVPGWTTGGVPGGSGSPTSGVPLTDAALGLRPYEEVAASTGAGPSTGLLAGTPAGSTSSTSLLTYAGAPPTGFNTTGPGFQSTEYPERARRREEENRERQNLPAVPPTVVAPPPPPAPVAPPPPADPWAGRVQIFGPGAEGFASDTSAQWLARWPSQAQAEQKPGTDNWYLPVGVTR